MLPNCTVIASLVMKIQMLHNVQKATINTSAYIDILYTKNVLRTGSSY